jgi:hypothetical protein
MIRYLIGISIIICSFSASAEFDFSSLESLEKSNAENQEKKELTEKRQAKAKAEARHKHSVNVYREKNAKAKVAYQDKQKDKNRQQAYEDQLRSLEIQVLTARANRTDDYINAELAREVAKTDGVQSEADRTRMKGAAEIIRAKNIEDVTVIINNGN